MATIVISDDPMQPGYRYELTAPKGKLEDGFAPDLSPAEMLWLGVFGGSYFPAGIKEYPADWFAEANLSDHGPDPQFNCFKVLASQPYEVWLQKGWIYPDDPRGWFQWYCRYWLGRRIPEEDKRQIARSKAFRRHLAQLERACKPGDIACRPRQRQALLQWGYDSRRY